MTVIKKAFEVTYTLEEISVVTPKKIQVVEGKSYPSYIELRTTNLVEDVDPELGTFAVERILITKIPCDEANLREANIFFNAVRESRKPLILKGDVSRSGNKGMFTATTYQNAVEIMQANKHLLDLPKKS